MLSDLYKLRVKVFFGVFRASKTSLALFFLYGVSMIPGTVGMSIVVVESIKKGIDLTVHLEELSAIISGLMALIILSTFRGFTVFEYEQSFILTSPITPIYFLISGLLADLTVFSFFFYPLFLFLGIVSVSLNLSTISVLSMALIIFLFAFLLIFLKISLSILGSVYQKLQINLISITVIVFLLFPAVGLFARSPIRYSDLPYPSTILAHSILDTLLNGLPSTISLLGLASYFLCSFALFLFSSSKNLFQFANPVPLVSPFDSSMRVQTVKMGKNIKLFSRTGLGVTLDLESQSLLRFLMKKELIRMIRDGSLFAVLLFYVIVSIISIAGSSGGMPGQMWIFTLGIYSFIIPSMLISNWRISELANLWVPLTSGLSLGYIVKSLLYDLTLIAFIVPASAIALLTLTSRINPLTPLVLVASVSLIGCSTNLYVMMRFLERGRKATPSFMIGWLSMLLTGILMAPTYIYVSSVFLLKLSTEIDLVLSILITLYSFIVFIYLSKRIEKKVQIIEI